MRDFACVRLGSFVLLMVVTACALIGCRDPKKERAEAIQAQEERIRTELKAAKLVTDETVECPDFHLLKNKVGDWIRCGADLEGDDPQLYEAAVKRVTNEGALLHVKPVTLSVDKENIESRAAQMLAAHPDGYDIEEIACPEHLIGIPGKSVRCNMALSDGRSAGLTAILKGIEGGLSTPFSFTMKPGTYTSTAVRYMIAFDVPPEQVGQAVRDMLDERGGKGPDSLPDAIIACTDFLPATEGAVIRCPLLHGGKKTHEAIVKYESADAKDGQLKAMIEVEPLGQVG